MKEMEIRCCCSCKLLGTVPVPDETALGDRLVLNGLEFEVASVYRVFGPTIAALKSRDYPYQKILEIPGFQAKKEEKVNVEVTIVSSSPDELRLRAE